MKTTSLARHAAKRLFRSCWVQGQLDEDRVRQTVQAVIARKPRHYLAVLTLFVRLVRLALEHRSAHVDSAIPLPLPFRTTIESDLAGRYGPGLEWSYADDPAWIGGVRIQVGSDVYDGTLRGRLAALLEQF